MLNEDDFDNLVLPKYWHYTLNKDGDGYCIDFLVRTKAVLRKTKKDYFLNDDGILTLSPRYVIEMATFYITKNPCSKDSM